MNDELNKILLICDKIENTIKLLNNKIKELRCKFELLSKRDKSPLFVYSLDSVFFLFNFCNSQIEDFKKTFDFIRNHIYCDLFKLHRIICNFVKSNVNDNTLVESLNSNNFPVYYDLEKYKVYDYDTIKNIYQDIIRIIESVNKFCNLGNEDFESRELDIHNGFHHDKILQTFKFNTKMIQEKIDLISNFLKYSCDYHYDYLQKTYIKIDNLHLEIPPLENDKKNTNEISINSSGIKYNKKNKKNEIEENSEKIKKHDQYEDHENVVQKKTLEIKKQDEDEENYQENDEEEKTINIKKHDSEENNIQDDSKKTNEIVLTIEDNNSEQSTTTKKKRGRPKKNI